MKIPYLHPVFEFISSNSLGVIPLDILAHITIGAFLAIVFKRKNMTFSSAFLLVLVAAIIKEIYDLPRLTSTPLEHTKDITFSVLPVAFIYSQVLFQRAKNSAFQGYSVRLIERLNLSNRLSR